MNDFPRRNRIDKMTIAERAIYETIGVVEAVGADVRLTDAVNLLQAARDSVADFVDGIDKRRSVTESASLGSPDRSASRIDPPVPSCTCGDNYGNPEPVACPMHAAAAVSSSSVADSPTPQAKLAERITDYLGNGGFFNPEAMEHDKVRDLLMDCRDYLQSAP